MRRKTRRLLSVLAVVMMATLLAYGVAVAATITGDADANEITGTNDADSLYGYGGDDNVSGGSAADRIYGGDGNDLLFGTDKYQSGVNDGSQTSVDGNDRIEGENGDDNLVGASGADTLRGGPGADTIAEGPANDAAADIIEADPTFFSGGPPPESATWNDKIDVVSVPARKDTVNCGPGTDEVQADPLDVVNSNCENVEVIEPVVPDVTVGSEQEFPDVISTEGDEATTNDPDSSETPDATPSGYRYNASIQCWAAPWYRGATRCATAYVYPGEWVGIGAFSTSQDRWIYGSAWIYGDKKGAGRIRKGYDNHDWLYYSTFGVNSGIYGRTSCWSTCGKWTWWDGWVDYSTD